MEITMTREQEIEIDRKKAIELIIKYPNIPTHAERVKQELIDWEEEQKKEKEKRENNYKEEIAKKAKRKGMTVEEYKIFGS